MDNYVSLTLGEKIRKRRKAIKMFVKTLAEKVDVSSNYINMIEHNKRNPSYETLEKIANALNTSVDALMAEQKGTINPKTNRISYETKHKTKVNVKTNKLQEMQLILYMLKMQKPGLFPTKVCKILDITPHELYKILDGKKIDCPKWDETSKLLFSFINKRKFLTLFDVTKEKMKNKPVKKIKTVEKEIPNE